MLPFRSIRHAARRLARVPGFATGSIVTLGLGVGAATAVFTLVHAVLLRPLPYPAPERLVSLSHTLVVGQELRVDQSDASLLFYGRHQRAFTDIGGYQITAAALSASGEDAERVSAARVTAGLFPVLSVVPLHGRIFVAADDRPGAAPVVVISEALWTRRFGRDPGLIDRLVTIDGVAHEVVGIMPAAVRFPAPDTALWVPMRLNPARTESATFDYQAIARLDDDESLTTAASALQALLPRIPDEFPGRLTRASIDATRMQVSVRPLDAVVVGDIGGILWVALGASGFVLLVACANVAGLCLVRAESRYRDVAVQRALGASRGAVLVEFLSEGTLVATAGSLLGVAISVVLVQLVRAFGGAIDIPRLDEVRIDSTVLGVAVLIAAVSAVWMSVIPAWRSASPAPSAAFAADSRSATASRGRQRVRFAVVVAQVAFALVLLVGAGLMAASVWRLRSVQPGFDPANATTFRLALPAAIYPDAPQAAGFFIRAIDAIEDVAGVERAGAVSKLPLDERGRIETAVFLEDRPLAPGSLPGIHPVSYASPGYFEAAGIPFVEGRTFARPDTPAGAFEIVVSRAFADHYWPGGSAIGRRVRTFVRSPLSTIVGVVGDVRDTALDRPVDRILYSPILPAREDIRWTPRDLAIVVRAPGDPVRVTTGVRDVVRALDPALPLYRVRPFTRILAQASARRSFALLLIGCAAGIALLLGAVGLYSVMSYAVRLRTREMGIRLALGAEPRDVQWMVSRQGLAVASAGVAIGIGAALLLGRALTALLFEIEPTDPAIIAAAAAVLLAITTAATWVAARRAARVDPVHALRAE
jgi:predicted permease